MADMTGTAICPTIQICVNSPGSYDCSCPEGTEEGIIGTCEGTFGSSCTCSTRLYKILICDLVSILWVIKSAHLVYS